MSSNIPSSINPISSSAPQSAIPTECTTQKPLIDTGMNMINNGLFSLFIIVVKPSNTMAPSADPSNIVSKQPSSSPLSLGFLPFN